MKTKSFFFKLILLAVMMMTACVKENIKAPEKRVYLDHLVFETVPSRYKEKPADEAWKDTTARIIAQNTRIEAPQLTAWGGRLDVQASAIEGKEGYFRLGRVGNRWVFVDPDNGVNIIRGTQNLIYPEGNRFASADDWAAETAELLSTYGFNHADFGGVRPEYQREAFNQKIANPSPDVKNSYSIGLNFLRSFIWDDAKFLSWEYDDTNNEMNRLNLIFEKRYELYLERSVAQICAQYINDPYLLGYQLDNELGFRGWDYRYGNQDILIHKFLKLPEQAAARQYAEDFVKEFNLNRDNVMKVTKTKDVEKYGLSEAYDEFRLRVAEKYYKQYHDVIRKYDPNHLIFGSRLHSNGKYDKQTLQACAKYCDVVTINYYGVWTPETDFIDNFRAWTNDRPFFITEFYVKGEDANYDGIPYNNLSGGGWVVPTQIDRGIFYQTFCLGLLEADNCAGWTYFAYDDVYSTDGNSSNRGLVSAKFYPWIGFLDGVGRVNRNVYAVMDYFDK